MVIKGCVARGAFRGHVQRKVFLLWTEQDFDDLELLALGAEAARLIVLNLFEEVGEVRARIRGSCWRLLA